MDKIIEFARELAKPGWFSADPASENLNIPKPGAPPVYTWQCFRGQNYQTLEMLTHIYARNTCMICGIHEGYHYPWDELYSLDTIPLPIHVLTEDKRSLKDILDVYRDRWGGTPEYAPLLGSAQDGLFRMQPAFLWTASSNLSYVNAAQVLVNRSGLGRAGVDPSIPLFPTGWQRLLEDHPRNEIRMSQVYQPYLFRLPGPAGGAAKFATGQMYRTNPYVADRPLFLPHMYEPWPEEVYESHDRMREAIVANLSPVMNKFGIPSSYTGTMAYRQRNNAT